MSNVDEKEVGGAIRIFLRCVGIHLEAAVAGRVRMEKTAGQSPEHQAIQGQTEYIDGEIVEDVLPVDIEKLEKL